MATKGKQPFACTQLCLQRFAWPEEQGRVSYIKNRVQNKRSTKVPNGQNSGQQHPPVWPVGLRGLGRPALSHPPTRPGQHIPLRQPLASRHQWQVATQILTCPTRLESIGDALVIKIRGAKLAVLGVYTRQLLARCSHCVQLPRVNLAERVLQLAEGPR
jgi:hypothetical protein